MLLNLNPIPLERNDMNASIAIGLAVIFLGYLVVLYGIRELYPDPNKYVLKTKVVKALDETAWNKHRFQGISDEAYYPVKDIDEKIQRLNKVLKGTQDD